MTDDPNDPDLAAALSDALETLRAMRLSAKVTRVPRVVAAWSDPATHSLRVTVEFPAAPKENAHD